MHNIDMQTWPRREHFKLYNSFNHPHWGICANVDLTKFYPYVKQHKYSLTVSIVYVITRASNDIPEFRQRVRSDQVIEHDIVHPGFTILISDDIFTFCILDYTEDFSDFAAAVDEKIAYLKTHPGLKFDPERDDMLYMSPNPWITFTGFMNPMQMHPGDSIPRYAWGKYFKENDTLKMPLQVQGHHAVMDGLHMGRFYEKVQDYLYHPEVVLGST